ncbi:uncharacterized protein LOC120151688 [Hibiscus syriacus]|uniref:uncharacterized protein LOC120151688 n=1 Tax=Hibiscus syriacus TaxID=106335 RepID=UPI001923A669|nr:uncharacterized protein LOC120151688 [Hibiscus syriacus]
MEPLSSELNWRKLFRGTKEQSLEYFSPELLEGISIVKPPVAVIEEGIAEWGCAVVGQFIGDAPNFGSIDWVLENGPWQIQNKHLVLRKWEPNLRKLDFDLKRMPVWVHLYNVPLELFSRVGLSYIASAVGNPLYMDSVTASKDRLEFAKVCVEVEAGAVIPEVIHIVLRDGSFAKIRVYAPWFPKICLQCNTFGRLASSCAEVLKGPSKTKETKETHFWRKKVNSSAPANAGKERLVSTSSLPLAPSTFATQKTQPNSEMQRATSLQLGVIEEVSVLALQLTATTLQVEKKTIDNPGKDDQVKLLPDLASQGSKLEVKENVVSQSLGNIVITNPVKEVSGSGDLINAAGDKIIPKATNCDEDFPSLQDSLNQKKKARGKKKDNIGSSSKLESLAGGGVLDGPRKTRTTSFGVAMLLNEIKTKRKSIWIKLRMRLWVLWRKGLSFSFLRGCDQAFTIAGDVTGHSMVITDVEDFNVVANAQESLDFDTLGVHSSSNMDDVKGCLVDLELQDHPFSGPLFTWSNKQENSYLAQKLDRILINSQWLLDFPDSFVEFQAQGVSDHTPGIVWSQRSAQCAGNPMQIFFCKMKRIKPLLREFNKSYFSDISGRVTAKRVELESIQIHNLGHVDHRRVAEEKMVQAELIELETAESEFYRQKAKAHWLKEGDMSTKFFHQRVESNKKRNTIRMIKDENGEFHESFDGMASELVNFFKGLIGTPDPLVKGCYVEWLKSLLDYSLPDGADVFLVGEITDKEIKEALFRHGKDKSQGPNGYTSWFFKVAWEIVCKDFFVCYKEIVRGYSRKNLSPRCSLKIDLQKAFDSVCWDFLLNVLEALGLPAIFCGWIKACVSTPRYSISLSLVGYFLGARGVRQGDPLSPYLFVIVMNVLSVLLNVAARDGVFRFHPKCKKICLTHICFADDLLLFFHGTLDSVVGVISILDKFYELFGLRLNAMKSEFFSCGVSVNSLQQIRLATGFKISQLPGSDIPAKGARVSWSQICCLKSEGGLGLRKLIDWSKACYLMLVRKILADDGSLWIAWIKGYCFKTMDYWNVGCKTHFSWILIKLLKLRDEARRLFWPAINLTQIKGGWIWDSVHDRRDKESRNHLFLELSYAKRFGVLFCELVDSSFRCCTARMTLCAG